MLNVALVGLLAGSLALGPITGDGDDDKKNKDKDSPRTAENATPGVFETDAPSSAQDLDAITADTYALGIPSDAAPIKLWASYAYGTADDIWTTNGEASMDGDGTDGQSFSVAGTPGDKITTQRINVGAQINAINFSSFKVGAGALLTVAKNEFTATGQSAFTNGVGDLESDFGLQGLKVFGTARGRVVGVHGGYIFDFGSEREFGEQARANTALGELPLSQNAAGDVQPTPLVAGDASFQPLLLPTLSNSDGRDAITFGADFDYPSERFRLFGGIDYFMLQGIDDDENTAADESLYDNDDLLNFMFGAGVKLSIVEIGAALQIQTRYDNPIVADVGTVRSVGSHAGTIAPYLRISPPNLPASLFVKGAVQEEYTEFGYALGGANSPKPDLGFTAGLSIGFE